MSTTGRPRIVTEMYDKREHKRFIKAARAAGFTATGLIRKWIKEFLKRSPL